MAPVRPRLLVPALPRLVLAVVAGAVCGVAAAYAGAPDKGVLSGIAVSGTVFVVLGWWVLWPMDADTTRASVKREDFNPVLDELVVMGAALLGLGGIVGLILAGGADAGRAPAIVAVLGVFMAWAALHLMYAARYAYHYYADGVEGGIAFNEEGYRPAYRDFFYFSYNLGMTYQVSDTAVTASKIRSVVLRHCLLSYVFGVAVLATVINLVVGVVTG
jgi:uncharacterized membrane protein